MPKKIETRGCSQPLLNWFQEYLLRKTFYNLTILNDILNVSIWKMSGGEVSFELNQGDLI